MKKIILIISSVLFMWSVGYAASYTVGTDASSPPMESLENSNFVGFDIDITNEIMKRMGNNVATFKNMNFTTLMPAINSNMIDFAVSSITITEERAKNYDFSIPYMHESVALLYRVGSGLSSKDKISKHIVCVELGTSNEIWAKANLKSAKIISMDTESQCVEAVKSSQVDVMVLDGPQSIAYVDRNPKLENKILMVSAERGYGFMFKKGSELKPIFDKQIKAMESDGTLDKLKQKWGLK